MLVFLYIMVFLLIVTVLILISPIRLLIDTNTNEYVIKWKGIFQARMLPINSDLIVRLRMFWFIKDFNLLQARDQKKVKKGLKKKSKRSASKKKFKMTFSKMKKILKTFSVRAFYVNMDTDNYIQNGYLFTIFNFIKSQNKSFKINYVGHNQVQLIVENRLYRIIKAYLF